MGVWTQADRGRRLIGLGIVSGWAGLAMAGGPAGAAVGAPELSKLNASDSTDWLYFGRGPAVRGDLAVIGAIGDATKGPFTGAAYVFDISDPVKPVELRKLTADDGAANDHFGFGIAIGDGFIVIGARLNDGYGEDAGAAYVFDTETGAQLTKFIAEGSGPGEQFGFEFDIDGDTLVVSGQGTNEGGRGRVFAFDMSDPASPVELVEFIDPAPPGVDLYGHAIALDDGLVLIGALKDTEQGFQSGAAYVFDLHTGDLLHKLLPEDAEPDKLFGYDVDLQDGVAVIGAMWDDEVAWTGGAVYLFDAISGEQVRKFTASDVDQHDGLGQNVVAIGPVVAARSSDDTQTPGAGAVYFFDMATGEQITKLLASDGAADDAFGGHLVADAGRLLAASVGDDDIGYQSGSVYIFDVSGLADACPPDLDGSGDLTSGDLNILLGAFGCSGGACPGDVNGDGVTDTADLNQLLGAFGSVCD